MCVCVSACSFGAQSVPTVLSTIKKPARSAQGSLQKEGQRDCKSQRKKTNSCESVPTRNVRRNTPII